MNRKEMIELLIEDRINDWVGANNTDDLIEVIAFGWEGFEKYTDEELVESVSYLCEGNFDEEVALKIKTVKALFCGE